MGTFLEEDYQDRAQTLAFAVEGEQEAGMASDDVRLQLALKILKQTHEGLGNAIRLLEKGEVSEGLRNLTHLVTQKQQSVREAVEASGCRVVEGVFDGCEMVCSNGGSYSIPPNYASKSRLVEGDVLKLTIRADGSFIYKQIGPVERIRRVGKLGFDPSCNSYTVTCGKHVFRILTASVTFFKGEPGDKVVALLPKTGDPVWAAVENIVKE